MLFRSRGGDELKLGDLLRYFGDGWQIAKKIGDRRYWRIPVMDGEFVCESTTNITKGAVGGGNLLIWAPPMKSTLACYGGRGRGHARGAGRDHAISRRHRALGLQGRLAIQGADASTNDAFCPTLRGQVATELDDDLGCVLEIVIDGLTEAAVAAAMRAGLTAIADSGPKRGARPSAPAITAASSDPSTFNLKELAP